MKEYDYTGAARFLGISRSAVSQHVGKGHIKTTYRAHLGIAGRVVITEKELWKFIWSDYYTMSERFEHKEEVE